MPTLSFFQLLILLLLAFLLFGDITKLKERIKQSLGDDKSTKDSKVKQKKLNKILNRLIIDFTSYPKCTPTRVESVR